MANQIEKLNTIAIADIEKVDTLTDAQIEKINTLNFLGVEPGQQVFTSSGTFTVPTGVTSVCVVCIAGGSGGDGVTLGESIRCGGGGGALQYKNNISVTPGASITVTCGAGGAGSTAHASEGNN